MYGLPLFHVDLLRIQMTRCNFGRPHRARTFLSRSTVERAAVIARIISGLVWDFKTIMAVNPRYHLSRRLILPSFFPAFNDTVCSAWEISHSAPISLYPSICPSVYLSSLPIVFISLSIPGMEETRETDEGDVGLQANWYRLVSGGTGRSAFCVEPVERMNYLSESLISRATKWNVGTSSSPPFRAVFTGARAPFCAPTFRRLTLTAMALRAERVPHCRATSNNYFYGVSYKDRNGKYEDRLRPLIFSLS